MTIEFADPDFAAKIKELSRKDFLNVRDREKRIKKDIERTVRTTPGDSEAHRYLKSTGGGLAHANN